MTSDYELYGRRQPSCKYGRKHASMSVCTHMHMYVQVAMYVRMQLCMSHGLCTTCAGKLRFHADGFLDRQVRNIIRTNTTYREEIKTSIKMRKVVRNCTISC